MIHKLEFKLLYKHNLETMTRTRVVVADFCKPTAEIQLQHVRLKVGIAIYDAKSTVEPSDVNLDR